jgi:hypothetical protein
MLVMSKFKEQLVEELEMKLKTVPLPQQWNEENIQTFSVHLSKAVFSLVYDELHRELGNLRTRLERLENVPIISN